MTTFLRTLFARLHDWIAPVGYQNEAGFHEGHPGDDPEYQTLMDELARDCTCFGDRPCDGAMAGGLCDNLQIFHGDEEEEDFTQ